MHISCHTQHIRFLKVWGGGAYLRDSSIYYLSNVLTLVRLMVTRFLKILLLKAQMAECQGSTCRLVGHNAICQIILQFLGPVEKQFYLEAHS